MHLKYILYKFGAHFMFECSFNKKLEGRLVKKPLSMMQNKCDLTLLKTFKFLDQKHIKIKDTCRVNDVLSKILNGGFSQLQMILDFDYTLTRNHYKGQPCHCSWGILDNSDLMPAFYREIASVLVKKYYPIEIDPVMSEEEKIPYMVEWYQQIYQLLSTCCIRKEQLPVMVRNSTVMLRDSSEELFKLLQDNNVPLLIFSAGMGDILEHVLLHFNLYSENVKVVSNFFQYDENDIMTGFKGELIHMFNKNENAVHSSSYFSKLRNRNNVVLMGDSLGDTKMAYGVPEPNSVLKIGFLNDKVEQRLKTYMEAYDIVLIDDQTMNTAVSILKLME